jgi:hypothetical protein
VTTSHQHWRLRQHLPELTIARLPANSDLPAWAGGPPLLSVTWNVSETSVICARAPVPADVLQTGPFQAFELEGPLDFTLTGVLSGLLGPLADEGISVFTVSTFDTDWILVPTDQASRAANVWRYHGHTIDTD